MKLQNLKDSDRNYVVDQEKRKVRLLNVRVITDNRKYIRTLKSSSPSW